MNSIEENPHELCVDSANEQYDIADELGCHYAQCLWERVSGETL